MAHRRAHRVFVLHALFVRNIFDDVCMIKKVIVCWFFIVRVHFDNQTGPTPGASLGCGPVGSVVRHAKKKHLGSI